MPDFESRRRLALTSRLPVRPPTSLIEFLSLNSIILILLYIIRTHTPLFLSSMVLLSHYSLVIFYSLFISLCPQLRWPTLSVKRDASLCSHPRLV